MSESAIYEGTIRHRRFAVREHEFRYRIAMAYIDLDELPALLGGRLTALAARARALPPQRLPRRSRDAAGRRRPRRSSESASATRPRARSASSPTCAPSGTASTRSASTTASRPTASTLEAIVAEVTNTPWGERHAYVLKAGDPIPRGGFDKALHVSPFMPMDQRYTWKAPAPGATLSVQIESAQGNDKAFDATLALKRRPLTRRALARRPAATLRMLALIYGHAVALKLKGVPVQPHPAR